MNTLANTIATTVQTILTTAMPTSKTVATESMRITLTDAIMPLLPVRTSYLTSVTRAMLPALKGGAMFDSLADDVVINIPAFVKATRAGYTEVAVPAHSVTFRLPSYDIETVRYFSLALAGLMVQHDWDVSHNDACKLTALVDYVIPVLKGLATVTTVVNARVDYAQAITTLGLDYVASIEGVTYDNYTTGQGKTNHGLSVIVPKESRSLVETDFQLGKAKNSFLFRNAAGVSFDVIRTSVQDSDGIETIGLKYRFTVTKA